MSEKLKRLFQTLNFNVIFKINNKLNNIIVKGKDNLSKSKQHNVIYKINCKSDNCKKSYIGQTKRALEIRIKEHRNNYKLPNHKVITTHMLEEKHEFDWENVKLLDIEQNYFKRNLSEMLHIKTTDNTLNAQTDTVKLSNIYNPLFFN